MNRTLFFWLLIIGLGLLVVSLIKVFPGALGEKENQIHLVSTLAILSYLFLLVLSRRVRFWQVIQYLTIWLGIGLVVLVGYSFKGDLWSLKERLSQQLMPTVPHSITPESVSVSVSQGGHFVVDGNIDGTTVRFLLDSGASSVVLTRQDARRVGISVNELDFTQPTQTANGVVFSAPVVIPRIDVGSIRVDDVKGAVSRGGLTHSLLGMSFLSRLKSWRVEGSQLILEK
jgi:aspartyl protease family protein